MSWSKWHYGLNVCVLLKSLCWTLTPTVVVFGDETFERWLGHEGGVLRLELGPLEEDKRKDFSPPPPLSPPPHLSLSPWPCTKGRPWENTQNLKSRKRAFNRTFVQWPKLWENKFWEFKPLHLWNFFYSSLSRLRQLVSFEILWILFHVFQNILRWDLGASLYFQRVPGHNKAEEPLPWGLLSHHEKRHFYYSWERGPHRDRRHGFGNRIRVTPKLRVYSEPKQGDQLANSCNHPSNGWWWA